MSRPTAAVRITLTDRHLEDGWVSQYALREVQCLLYDVPAEALVYFDLGPLRRVDDALVSSLALLSCAQQIRFESPAWRVAQDSALTLVTLLVTEEAVTHG